MRKTPHKARYGGFALIVTLSLMILLTVIAVGLLSLSSITLRSSGAGVDVARARANARMALLLAIGELQKDAGLDTRVTAKADILDSNHPPVLGVWKSWEGTDHESSGNFAGRPVAPDYGSKRQNATSGNGRFLHWLVSGDPATKASINNVPDLKRDVGDVTLVGVNTLGASPASLQVHLPPVRVGETANRGAYAWWVSGENQKARLPLPEDPEAAMPDARLAAVQKSDSAVDPAPFGMDSLLADPAPAGKVTSLKQSDFIIQSGAEKASRKNFHDLSAVSTGLLTNTATGGWRKDLSLFTENYAALPSSGLPLFRLTPAADNSVGIPKDNAMANFATTGFMLYPWAAYRGTDKNTPGERQGASASWRHLANYASSYKLAGSSAPFRMEANIQKNDDYYQGKYGNGAAPQEYYNYLHSNKIMPIVARVQWVFSYYAILEGGSYYPQIMMTPIVTLWNPYNVAIRNIGEIKIITGRGGRPDANNSNITSPLPCAFKYSVTAGTPAASGYGGSSDYRGLTKGYSNYGANGKFMAPTKTFCYKIPSVANMLPGATRVYSPTTIADDIGDDNLGAQANIDLSLGYHGVKAGFSVRMISGTSTSARIKGKADSTTQITGITFDNALDDSDNVGVRLSVRTSKTADYIAASYQMAYPKAVAKEIYPDITNLATSTSLATLSQSPQPFFSAMFNTRLASNTNIPAKGFVQTNPLSTFTLADPNGEFRGTRHPVNMPFDLSFFTPESGPGGTAEPNEDDGSGFIITGFESADGLKRCIVNELPTQPLSSLAELQHWDVRYENPAPPFSFNIIGNSDATPLVAPASVTPAGADSTEKNLQHDDSYCANHLLFDDWFFSSIAAGTANQFGASGSLLTNFTAFADGTKPLINRAYQPLPGDAAKASGIISPSGSWRNIASHIEVKGMFNVNSTSQTAWRALLGHARNQKIPYFQANSSIGLSEKTDHAANRFSVAGDVEAGKPGSSGDFSKSSEFAGYRVLDDTLIDKLAEKIVDEVRKRGPFLSLSEFVNRQLSSDKNLAVAGALQAALNSLGKDLYGNIENTLSSTNKFATANPPYAANTDYQFKEAAEGISIYGLPGWTRQADILRPLAPILSARDDTFTIRAYGDARNSAGTVVATAVCEAVVRRGRDYCNSADAADLAGFPTNAENKTFGRRFNVISFRWLTAQEI